MAPVLPAHGGDRRWAAALASCREADILDFSASINPWGPPPGVLKAWAEAFDELVHYPDPHCRALRSALAGRLQVDPERIVCGNGAAELLGFAARECASCGTTVLPVPGFGDYRRALAAQGAAVHPVPLAADFDLPPLPGGDAVILTNPHNPSGRLYGLDHLAALLGRFRLAVIDEAFIDFLADPEAHSALRLGDRPGLVIVRSLTKFYSLPGLRLGYAVLPGEMARRWQQWRDPWSVNALAQELGLAALFDQDFERRTRTWLPPAREALATALAALPGLSVFPAAANFLLVRSQVSALLLQKQLICDHRILIRHCTTFEGLGEHYFRVAVRSETENARLIAGLKSLLSAALQ